MSGKHLFLCFIMMLVSSGSAVTGAETLRFDSWNTNDGVPQNSVLATTKTRDGYLWVGTFEGLSRFDGVNFATFNNVNSPVFESNFIKALHEDRSGTLWIGVDGGGLVRRINGQFRRVTADDGFNLRNVIRIFETASGAIAIGTDNAGFALFENGVFRSFNTSDGLPSDYVAGFADDADGNLWVATRKGLARLKDGVISQEGVPASLLQSDLRIVSSGPQGEFWLGTRLGLKLMAAGQVIDVNLPVAEKDPRITALLTETNGDVWIGTYRHGLWRKRRSNSVPELVFEAPGNNWIASITRDNEGNLWVGSMQGGLHRYRERRFKVFTTADGLAENNVGSIFQRHDGTILVAHDGGLDQYENGRFRPFMPPLARVAAIAEDTAGNLWLAMSDRFRRIDQRGQILELTAKDGLRPSQLSSVLARRDGSVVLSSSQGLWEFRGEKLREITESDGLPNRYVINCFEDRAGNTWIGTRAGLARMRDGKLESWTIASGLANDHILSFREDSDGTLWIGTSGGGLLRYRDNQFKTINSRQGLYDNLSFVILEDSARNLWFCGNRGIYQAGIDALNAVADGTAASLSSFSYDRDDGLLNRECNGASPAGLRDREGRFWFPTAEGVAVIDPASRNSKPPTVIIEGVTLGGVSKETADLLEINPNEGNLEIRYTGISWDRPTKVTFRYKLEGLSDEWNDVGERRTAYFSFLPPGDYSFQVIADNGEGVWDAVGKTIKIRVHPPFYRTWWFTVMIAGAVFVVGFWLYRWRIGQLQRARLQQQEFSRKLIASQELERKRIAAELHDSLGQRLVIIKNLALIFLGARKSDEDLSQIQEISAEASDAISEVRTISYNLRPYQLDRMGLTKALKAVIKSAESGSEIEFVSTIDELDGFFPKDSEINFYRIFQETVTNVVKHSEATRSFVTIRRSDNLLEFEVADDGIGFTPGQTTSKTGGFGLQGIAERVALLGGDLEIRSIPGQGSTVRIKFFS